MSRVYVAVIRGPGHFNKLQVIKRLLPTLASDPDFRQMFLDEARLSARLNHSNIVQINEVGFDGAHYFMAMEYLEGQTLDAIVRRTQAAAAAPVTSTTSATLTAPAGSDASAASASPAPPVASVGPVPSAPPVPSVPPVTIGTQTGPGAGFTVAMHLRILADVAAGLHYAHELSDIDGRPLQIVHRDVSPHNVFITYAGQVKVLDFGIAKAADSSHQTRTGVIKGKCAYMAPEQFQGKGGIDRRADIFALGVMVWQAITRTRLWKGLSDMEIYSRVSAGEIPSPLSVDPHLHPQLVSICERALAPDRENRYRTAAELAEAIDAYLDTLSTPRGSRDIGRCVSELFADSHAEVTRAIENELRKQETNSAEIPIFIDPHAPPADDASPPRLAPANDSSEGRLAVGFLDRASFEPPSRAKKTSRARRALQASVVLAALLAAGAMVMHFVRKKPLPDPGVASASAQVSASAPAQVSAQAAKPEERDPERDGAVSETAAPVVAPEARPPVVPEGPSAPQARPAPHVRSAPITRPAQPNRPAIRRVGGSPKSTASPPAAASAPSATVELPPPPASTAPPASAAPPVSSSSKPPLDRDPWHP
ncbi:serine/threonine protein kinase [Pendulispora albinea]|uniref:Serine/threonine protein kinase n=2 Tax=Pendulispora albinea TaxID=2741071 RepID=A0ABZ2LLU2_9BACT